jgi:hypothetical protein
MVPALQNKTAAVSTHLASRFEHPLHLLEDLQWACEAAERERGMED